MYTTYQLYHSVNIQKKYFKLHNLNIFNTTICLFFYFGEGLHRLCLLPDPFEFFLFISIQIHLFHPLTPNHSHTSWVGINIIHDKVLLHIIPHQRGMPILTIFFGKIYFQTLVSLKNSNIVNILQYYQMQY